LVLYDAVASGLVVFDLVLLFAEGGFDVQEGFAVSLALYFQVEVTGSWDFYEDFLLELIGHLLLEEEVVGFELLVVEGVGDQGLADVAFADRKFDVACASGAQQDVDVLSRFELKGEIVVEGQGDHLAVVHTDFDDEILIVGVVEVDFVELLSGQEHEHGGVGSFLMEVGSLGFDSKPPLLVLDIVGCEDGDVEVAEEGLGDGGEVQVDGLVCGVGVEEYGLFLCAHRVLGDQSVLQHSVQIFLVVVGDGVGSFFLAELGLDCDVIVLKERYVCADGTERLLFADFGGDGDVDVLFIGGAGVGEVEGVEVVDLHPDVAADHVHVDVDFRVQEARQDVPVLLVGVEVVRHQVGLYELHFRRLGDCIDVHSGLSDGGEFEEESAIFARFETQLVDFVSQGNAPLIVGLELFNAVIDLGA
jgi:hypothetical protein